MFRKIKSFFGILMIAPYNFLQYSNYGYVLDTYLTKLYNSEFCIPDYTSFPMKVGNSSAISARLSSTHNFWIFCKKKLLKVSTEANNLKNSCE